MMKAQEYPQNNMVFLHLEEDEVTFQFQFSTLVDRTFFSQDYDSMSFDS